VPQTRLAVGADMSIPFLDLVAPHHGLEEELMAAFRRALRGAGFVGGSEVSSFEQEFAVFTGSRGCVGVNSGTDALRFAYMAMGIRPGDEVITVPNTFIATTEALTQAGATIRFVDVTSDTMTMDPAGLEAAITSRSVGVVPVHLYGQPADMDPILALAAKHGLWVIEDAAQAHGAEYKGQHAGTMGALGAFSFYPGKNLGALGEAGATIGNDQALLENVRRLREHGQSRKYYHEIEGYNGRLDAIQAAFLRIKLRHLRVWNQQRRSAATLYRDALAGIAEIKLPVEAKYAKHVYHLFVIRAERRDALQVHLTARKIGTGLHYPLPLHLQNAYRPLGLTRGAFPVTERAADEILSLPMFPELTQAQVGRVADAIRSFYRG
jgi:dTDP-4-amino-4,6-dideoxygalactose transaminase